MTEQQKIFMKMAIELSRAGMEEGEGGPFGCIIVKDGVVVGKGYNSVLTKNDPTAHAEVVAIRDACQQLKHFQLDGCELYTSCEPCPMCMGAIYWARPSRVFYANTKQDAAEAGFDDDFIYQELAVPNEQRKIPFNHLLETDAKQVFQEWVAKEDKTIY